MAAAKSKGKPLKSHFNIQHDDDEDEDEDEDDVENNNQVAAGREHLTEEQLGRLEVERLRSQQQQKPDKKILNKSDVCQRLSVLGKTAAGDSYSYLKVSCTGMELTNVNAIATFKHLQFVDVSENKLTLASLQVLTELPYLLLLQADKNLIQSAALKRTKYLQVIIMNNNEIYSCHDIYQPELSTLELGYNQITKAYFENNMPGLKCLDLRYNIIRDLLEWDFPNLICLYLAGNKIKKLDGLENLISLRILHLRNNPIKRLDGFSKEMKDLQYLNVRNCKIANLRQIKKLKVLPSLEILVMKGTPYMGGTGNEEDAGAEEDEEVRVEMIAAIPKLKRINKNPVTDEERVEAKELMMQWLEEGDQDEEEEEEQLEEEQMKMNAEDEED